MYNKSYSSYSQEEKDLWNASLYAGAVNIAETVDNVEVERKMLMTIFQKGECDGLIVEGTKTSFPNPNVSLYQELERRGVPIVFLHCAYPELSNAVVVGMDDREGGRIAARRLINSGCRKIFGSWKTL